MKAAIYCRLSKEDKYKQFDTDESESIQNQKTILIRYAMERGWEIFDIFCDENYSGSSRERPGFKRMIECAKAGMFDILICKQQSRFSREFEMIEKYINGLFQEWGIRFISVLDQIDTNDTGTKKSAQISGLVNEWQLEDSSESIRRVFDDKRKEGKHIGSFARYGYKKDPDCKGHLIVDEPAAAVVREIFNLYANGKGKVGIAKILNNRGVPNPTSYRELNGQKTGRLNSGLWTPGGLDSILKSEMYIGNMVQKTNGSLTYKSKKIPYPTEKWIIVKDTHEPIIDRQTWEKVKVKFESNKGTKHNWKGFRLSGKLRCENCGRPLLRKRKKEYIYFTCPTRYLDVSKCIGANIGEHKLASLILCRIKELQEEYIDESIIENSIYDKNGINERLKRMNIDIENLKARIDKYDDYGKFIYMDKVKGKIGSDSFASSISKLDKEKEKLKHNLNDLIVEQCALEDEKSKEKYKTSVIKKYLDVDDVTKEMIDDLIEYIEIGKFKDYATPITVHWNF